MNHKHIRNTAAKFGVSGFLALVSALYVPAGPAKAAEVCDSSNKDHPAVTAFLESEAVAKAIAEQTSSNDVPGCIFVVEIGGSCGVAGCGTRVLVGQTFNSTGVNPQGKAVLAVTEIMRPSGKARPARPVKIVPY